MKPEFISHVLWAMDALAAANFGYQVTKKRGLEGAMLARQLHELLGNWTSEKAARWVQRRTGT
jgi:hypothetical protein